MEIKLYHSLTYTTDGVVPVHLVAKSILANERLMHESLRLLEEVIKDFQISTITVSVAKLTNESPLKEALAATLFISYQHDLEKEVSSLINLLTNNNLPTGQVTILTILVFLLTIFLIDGAIERLMPGRSVKAIKEEYEEKKMLVSKLLEVAPEDIQKAVDKRFNEGKQKSLIATVHNFFSPAKIESNTEITSDDGTRIPLNVINEVPSALDFIQLDRDNTYDLEAVVIEIHRADRDDNKHGWRAIIRDISDKKVRMELDPTIHPDDLYGKKVLRGDVTVVEELKDEGDYVIKTYHLRTVIAL